MLIKNIKIITWNQKDEIIEDGAIQIQEGMIKKIITDKECLLNSAEEIVDGKHQLIMPGNICAHTHFYGAFSRGMAILGNPAQSFPEILEKLWWPLDKALDEEAIRISSQLCIIDAIRHGTTTLFDHHASQNNITGSLALIAAVVDESGIRADLCYEVSDRAGKQGSSEGIKENTGFLKSLSSKPSGLLNGHFGMHASLSLGEDTLSKVRDAAPADVGFHIHVAEHPCDEYDSVDRYGMRVVDRLQKHGLLNPKTIVAHGVHLDQHEIDLLKENKVWLAHQPRSNMNNGVGLANIDSMLRAGVEVVMGNDGFSNSMWDEWKTCYLAHKLWHRDPRRMPADQVVLIGVKNNRELANQSFPGRRFGIIEEGATADLILVDYKPYTELTSDNLPWHIIYGFRESMITGTMVNGKFLMKDRALTTIDEERVIHNAMEKFPQVWTRYHDEATKCIRDKHEE